MVTRKTTYPAKKQRPLPVEKERLTFAIAAALVAPSAGLPAGFLTAPDSDGNVRHEIFENRYAEIGNPKDGCRLFGMPGPTLEAFPDMTEMQKASLRQNGAFVRQFNLAEPWLCHRLGEPLGNANYRETGILPNALCFKGGREASRLAPSVAATSIEEIKALVAKWTHEEYPRNPVVGQPSTPFQNVPGYGAG